MSGLDGITNVADGVNQRWITNFLSQPAYENFDELRIVLMLMFPNAFTQLGARKDTTRLPHQHLQ
jgi:hypothetical protein